MSRCYQDDLWFSSKCLYMKNGAAGLAYCACSLCIIVCCSAEILVTVRYLALLEFTPVSFAYVARVFSFRLSGPYRRCCVCLQAIGIPPAGIATATPSYFMVTSLSAFFLYDLLRWVLVITSSPSYHVRSYERSHTVWLFSAPTIPSCFNSRY